MPNLAAMRPYSLHPADDLVRLCFHADSAGRAADGSVSPCFRPADGEPTATAAGPGRPVSPCFRPEDGPVNLCHHAGDSVNSCFHPAEPPADGDVNSCFHPEEPPVNACRHAGDDLAAGLHHTLTVLEEQGLTALAVRL